MGISKRDYVTQMENYKKCLYRVAYSYMNDKTLALDALDEAFYKGYINRGKLKNEECFKTWLSRIVVNECLQLLRKNKREVLIDEIPEEAAEAFDTLPIRDAIGKLSQELASIIYLRFFGGYTLAETATILKIPQGTVATRERKALSILKLELAE
jgi:RNA polymerase sigma-70 factor (ECF subfamily)